MTKILITGATDGIGLETARLLAASGHHLLLHGRNSEKLKTAAGSISSVAGAGKVETYIADFSQLEQVVALADAVKSKHDQLDVLINNAGVLRTASPRTATGLDVRFVVNTLAPYLLTHQLLPVLSKSSRIVNLSSAAQAPVDAAALKGSRELKDMEAYSQSKLAITMWSRHMATEHPDGPMVVAVNPGSLLASKMVKEGFGVEGKDLGIGADILVRAALSDEFADASGKYYDNDAMRFAQPHADALDPDKVDQLVSEIRSLTEIS